LAGVTLKPNVVGGFATPLWETNPPSANGVRRVFPAVYGVAFVCSKIFSLNHSLISVLEGICFALAIAVTLSARSSSRAKR
jgi:hypothetical protein